MLGLDDPRARHSRAVGRPNAAAASASATDAGWLASGAYSSRMPIGKIISAAIAAAIALTAAAPGASPSVAAAGRCHTRGLAATLVREPAAAGQRYAALRLTNRGRRACTIFGYAGARLLGSDDRRVPTRIMRDHSRAPRRVLLRPGQHAAALWHWGAIPGPGEPMRAPCEPLARAVLITPPDETLQLRRSWRLGRVCEHGSIEEQPFSGPYG
jgi:hypothetical protein